MILMDPVALLTTVLVVGMVVGIALFLFTRAIARVGTSLINSVTTEKES